MAKTSLILIVTFFLAQTLNSTEIYGVPKIIDGDTMHINNKKIRLEGIDAPEIKQQCKKPFIKISSVIGFQFNKSYSCGVMAKPNTASNNPNDNTAVKESNAKANVFQNPNEHVAFDSVSEHKRN